LRQLMDYLRQMVFRRIARLGNFMFAYHAALVHGTKHQGTHCKVCPNGQSHIFPPSDPLKG
jgi:hypothetical protein